MEQVLNIEQVQLFIDKVLHIDIVYAMNGIIANRSATDKSHIGRLSKMLAFVQAIFADWDDFPRPFE